MQVTDNNKNKRKNPRDRRLRFGLRFKIAGSFTVIILLMLITAGVTLNSFYDIENSSKG